MEMPGSSGPPQARRLTALAGAGLLACLGLVGQVSAEASAARVAATCDPSTQPLIAVDEVFTCDGAVACDGGEVRAGDVFVAAGPCLARRGRMTGADLEALGIPVDVSTASEDELASLPGIGPELARRIAAARPLRSVDDLLRVHGIGPVRLAAMRSRVRVGRSP